MAHSRSRRQLLVWGAVAGLVLLTLACGGSAAAPIAPPAPAPQQPAQPTAPAPAAPAPEPQAPAVPALQPKVAAPAAPAAPAATTPKYGGTASFFVRADPRNAFEPHLFESRRESRAVINLALENVGVWDTLEGQPCTYNLRPQLAESWRFLDPTTVEIKLRQGVKFQNVPPVNGRELVADDVLFSWRRLLDRVPIPVADAMTSMEALDRYTIQIKTKEPQPLLIPDGLFAFRGAAIVAKEAADKEGRYDKRENIIGTGPFILTEYTPGVGHVAKRNPDYWVKGRPYLDGLRIPIMRDQSTRIAALQVGKLDFMEDIELNEREGLVSRKADVGFVDCDGSQTSAILVRNDLPPFNDVRVRRALSMALDREGIATGLFRGKGSVIALAPGSVPGALKPEEFPPEVRKYLQYNPTEAKKLLAEAGYPNGLDVEIFGTLDRGTIVSNTLEAIPGLLKPSGFNVKLKIGNLVAYNEGSINRNYGVAGLYSHTAIPIETGFLANLHSKRAPNINRVAANDPVLDKLIEQMLVTIDPAERLKVVHQIQVRIVDQMLLVVYPTGLDTYGVSRRLQGNIRVNNYINNLFRNLLFQDVWVTK